LLLLFEQIDAMNKNILSLLVIVLVWQSCAELIYEDTAPGQFVDPYPVLSGTIVLIALVMSRKYDKKIKTIFVNAAFC